MKSLFNEEIPDEPLHTPQKRDNAHAAAPGTGPAGETCGTCKFLYRAEYHNKVYKKCEKLRASWTRSYGTDIRCKDSACYFWKPKEEPCSLAKS